MPVYSRTLLPTFLHDFLPLLSLPINLQASVRGKSCPAFHGAANRRRASPKKLDVEAPIYTRHLVSAISKILRYSPWLEAKNKLGTLDVKWDSHIVNRVLKTHPPMEKAWLFFGWVSAVEGFKHDHYTYTTMLDIFGEAGRIKSMLYVFDTMCERKLKIDVTTYTSLMHWLSRSGDVDSAVEIWNQMHRNNCFPTVVSYTAYMKLLLDCGRSDKAAKTYKEMIEDGLQPTIVTYTVLMDHLFSEGKWQESLKIFSDMQEAGVQPDKAACNILIKRCCESNNIVAMKRILRFMKDSHLVLRYPEFIQALRTLKNSDEDDEILREVNPHLSTEECTNAQSSGSGDDSLEILLILFLLQTKKLKAVDFMIAEYTEKRKNLRSWVVSDIIVCYPASSAFEYSLKMNIHIEKEAYHSLIGASLKNSFVNLVEIVEEMIKGGYFLGSYLSAILIFKLGRSGMIDYAKKLFGLLPLDEKCSSSYTALMYAHFRAGNNEEAFEVFRTMKANDVGPSLGTYNVLLGGLKRAGMHIKSHLFAKEKNNFIQGGNFLTPSQKICDLLFCNEDDPYK